MKLTHYPALLGGGLWWKERYISTILPTTMALNIKNPLAERLARELANATGVSLTDAVISALESSLDALSRLRERASVSAGVAELQAFVRALPDRDTRSAEEILGYDAFGLPT